MARLLLSVPLLLAIAGCDGGKASPPAPKSTTRSYQIVPGNDSTAPPVAVSITVPPGWTEAGDHELRVPDLGKHRVALAALALSGDETARVTDAIEAQFDLDQASRTDLAGGRVWVQQPEPKSRIHARLFIPYESGVVMGIALVPQEHADRLPELRAVLETIEVGEPQPGK